MNDIECLLDSETLKAMKLETKNQWGFTKILFFVLSALLPGLSVELNWKWEDQSSGVETSIRALCAVDENVCWFGSGQGTVGRTVNGGKSWELMVVKGAEELEFRDVEAFDAKCCIAMSVGEGTASRIYKTVDGGKNWKRVYQNRAPKGFFDGIEFWDAKNGILAGDPVDGRLVILRTSDGGATWDAGAGTPKMMDGEHAFAASGTHLTVAKGGHVWVGSGGRLARVFYSSDFGKSWTIFDTPIIAGEDSTGIFSLSFKDSQSGVAVGGDYTKEAEGERNAMMTKDGGKSWKVVRKGDLSIFSFRSCVRYINDQKWVMAVGPDGCDISRDGGEHWEVFGNQGFHTFSFGGEMKAIWAAGSDGRIARLR
ncbi:MAG: hypothetical protein ABF382_17035 [Akkermansiaceae bacterium]|jgi:photosystem II stability/assembly factor-like uncharacterized protein